MGKSDFKQTYQNHINNLKNQYDHDIAMQKAIGSEFEAAGKIGCDLLHYHGLKVSDYIIDVGCGSGRIAKPLAQKHTGTYLGIDIMPELLEYAEKICQRPDWKFKIAQGLSIPEEDQQADMICFFSVFTHLLPEESYIYLQEAKRVLKPSGKIIFSFLEFSVSEHWPVFASSVNDVEEDKHLDMFLSREAITAWAQHLGLKLEVIMTGTEAYIPLSEPVVMKNGTVLADKAAPWQSVCVLVKE